MRWPWQKKKPPLEDVLTLYKPFQQPAPEDPVDLAAPHVHYQKTERQILIEDQVRKLKARMTGASDEFISECAEADVDEHYANRRDNCGRRV